MKTQICCNLTLDLGQRMALRGSEHVSAMLDWVEATGGTALSCPLSIKKRHFWSENNYRYTIKIDSNKKKTSKWVTVLDKYT